MKKMSKIMAMLLAAIMTMAMVVPAFAAGGHSLTVNVKSGQNLKNQTINVYKLFDVTESGSGSAKNYAYTVSKEAGYKDALVRVLGTPITAASSDEDIANAIRNLSSDKVQEFANKFTKDALKNSLAATASSGKITTAETSYTFNNLDAGYYLVYATGGKEIQSSLVTVDADTTSVNLKSEGPSITKTADKPSVEIGQVIKYTVTGSIPDTNEYAEYVYKIHDTLSDGLDFVKNAAGDKLVKDNELNVTVTFKDAGVTAAGTAPTTATLSGTGNRTMVLDLSEWIRANQGNKHKEFTVTYYAKVNKDAVVENQNSAYLEYSNKPGETTDTTPSVVKTPTYPIDINKVKKALVGTGTEKLAGAKFKLYRTEGDATAGTNAIKASGAAGKYVVDLVNGVEEFETVDEITGEGYNLRINGLAAGDYWLVETQAPDGFNKLTAPIKVTITKTGDATWTIHKDGTEETDKIIDIENSTGSLLPGTGGIGTILFAVVAVALILGVAASYIRDKRKEA